MHILSAWIPFIIATNDGKNIPGNCYPRLFSKPPKFQFKKMKI